mmetsp:Transcript_8444/g.26259  ORF Transcript_8444/g.26259 Transcript_8444/m.26259 type:complete len:329 (+) Transcript_8444:796-1782(+)
MRREVGGVDLELRADGPFDGPAIVQAKTHTHTIVRKPRQERWVLAVVLEYPRLVNCRNHLHKGDHAHVPHFGAVCLCEVLAHSPHNKEGVPDVAVGRTMPCVHNVVHNLCNLVYKHHDLVLQHLRRICEVPDVTEAEHGINLVARDHGVHCGTVVIHVLPDDLRASFTESQREQLPKFDDGILQDLGFQSLHLDISSPMPTSATPVLVLSARAGRLLFLLLLLPVRLISQLHGVQWVVPNLFDLGDHPLDGLQHQHVGIVAEDHGANGQNGADEDRLDDVVDCRTQHPRTQVEHKNDARNLVEIHQSRCNRVSFLEAEVFRATDVFIA